MAHPFSQLCILWAIEPFEPIGTIHRHTARMLKNILSRNQAEVIPVSVQSLPEFLERAASQWKKQFMKVFQDAVLVRLKELRVRGTHPPVILPCEVPFISNRVETLVSYSKRIRADLIVITSRKKVGLKKLFDDSFSETLFYQSNIPVLILSANIRSLKKIDHILFPTDFSTQSHALFCDVIQIASQMKARLTLFHAIETEQDTQPPHLRFRQQQKAQANKHRSANTSNIAQDWINEAMHAGVRSKFLMLETQNEIASEIVKLVRSNNISLIAMQDKSNRLSEKVIGSNTRQVVRKASCPVLVLKAGKRISPREVEKSVA